MKGNLFKKESFFAKGSDKVENGEFTMRPCKGCRNRFMIGKDLSSYCEKCRKLSFSEREKVQQQNKRKKKFIKFCSGGSMSKF